ncbi:MAG: hypothetical protein BGO59_10800 [Spirosoma sp. 48-14]|nr:MAG: hypothetical protein BGO59_10800 [Spirosoma sp. 48-14]
MHNRSYPEEASIIYQDIAEGVQNKLQLYLLQVVKWLGKRQMNNSVERQSGKANGDRFCR